jgi:acyl dehydratase
MSEYAIEDVRTGFGADRFTSGWCDVTQELMDRFADATHDPDWLHVDPERAAREGPFGGTIAFGFWTLSMLTWFLRECMGNQYPPEVKYGFNYGLNRVRLMAPVPVGSRVRDHLTITDIVAKGGGRFLVTTHNEVEVEGVEKPAMIADWLVMLVYPDAKVE